MGFRDDVADYKLSGDVILPNNLERPIYEYPILGFQHVVAMFGSTVLAPILMGFDPNIAVLFSGISTILFYIAVEGKIPSYLGSSFSFIAAVGAATGYSFHGPNSSIPLALGGIIAAGAIYFAFGLLVRAVGTSVIERLFSRCSYRRNSGGDRAQPRNRSS